MDHDDITSYKLSEYYTDTKSKKSKPPFKLCFGTIREIGRSSLSTLKFLGQDTVVTSKFYSRHDHLDKCKVDMKELDQQVRKVYYLGPRESFEEPVVESKMYGWYQDESKLMNSRDKDFYFPQVRSDMVKIQCVLLNALKAEKQFLQSQNVSQNK